MLFPAQEETKMSLEPREKAVPEKRRRRKGESGDAEGQGVP